jgi:4'-phosphopantetheinyl transferase
VRFVLAPDQFDPHWFGPQVWVIETASPAFGEGNGSPDLDSPLATRNLTLESVRRVLGAHLGLPSERVVVRADAHGRLSLDPQAMSGCPSANDLDFSVAHSGNVLLVAVSRGPSIRRIGVDVEIVPSSDGTQLSSLDPRPSTLAPWAPVLADGHFAAEERQWIEALPPGEQEAAFYRHWTAKEALVKALGLGVGFGLDQVQLLPGPAGQLRLAQLNGSPALAVGWTIFHRELTLSGRRAIAAVAFGN